MEKIIIIRYFTFFLCMSLMTLGFASAEIELGVGNEPRGIILGPPETNGPEIASNGTINQTFLDLVYKRLDSGNGATDHWDQNGFGITNIGNSEFIGSVVYRVGTTWNDLFDQPGLGVDCSNAFCQAIAYQDFHWYDSVGNLTMNWINNSGIFQFHKPLYTLNGISMFTGGKLNMYNSINTHTGQLGFSGTGIILEAYDDLILKSNDTVFVDTANFSVNNRVNLTQSGAIRATSITTSGSGVFAGGVTAGTSIMPSGAVSIGSAVTLFQNLFLSGVISDGSNPVTIANIAKLTANNQVFNGTINFTGNLRMSGGDVNISELNIVGSANYLNATSRLVPGLSTTTSITRGDGIICNMTWIDGGRVNSTFGDCG